MQRYIQGEKANVVQKMKAGYDNNEVVKNSHVRYQFSRFFRFPLIMQQTPKISAKNYDPNTDEL